MPNPRAVLGVAVLTTALLLQLTLLARLPLPGATPDLILLALVGLALRWGPQPGAVAGFLVGLAYDLVPPADGAVGQWALVLCLTGYAVGLFEGAAETSLLVPFAVVATAAVATSTVYAGLGALLGDPRVSWSLLGDLLPTAVLYDLVLTPFVVWAVLEIARRVEPEPVRW